MILNRHTRPIVAEFSGRALCRNAERAKALVPEGGQIFAVIKADAYGHGLVEVAQRLASMVDGFSILELSAAKRLRERGFQCPILMLEGFFSPNELKEFSALHLSTVVHQEAQIETLAHAKLDQPLDVYLKINTGMNRLGFTLSNAVSAFERLSGLSQVRSVTVMTHFADADNERGTAWQLNRLAEAWPSVQDQRLTFANSAALIVGPASRAVVGDMARPGIMIYGASPWGGADPGKTAHALGLAPVMSLKSQIIGIQRIDVGDRVGYGGAFVADGTMTIGIVACGYADGYPRHASNLAPVLVNGVRTKVVGRVSMDMLCCDLSAIPDAQIGSTVTLWGEGLPADDVAEAAGTIAYELFSGLAARVPRVWID